MDCCDPSVFLLVAENFEHSGYWDDADGCISCSCGSGDWFLNEIQRVEYIAGTDLSIISSATTPPQTTTSNII